MIIYIDTSALGRVYLGDQSDSTDLARVVYEGDRPVITSELTDVEIAETKDLIAGWMIVDVESTERAYEAAALLSSAPGPGGRPCQEWIEARPFLTEQATDVETWMSAAQ